MDAPTSTLTLPPYLYLWLIGSSAELEPSIAANSGTLKMRSWRNIIIIFIYYLISYEINIKILSSKGIEPFTAINQFFYRESPLPIGSPALNLFYT